MKVKYMKIKFIKHMYKRYLFIWKLMTYIEIP